MKFYKLLYDISPHLKCGTFLAAAGVSAGANAGTTIYTNERNLSEQKAENERNRQFSHAEAELSRNWQAAQWLKQYNIQRDEWYRQQQSMAETNYQQFLREAEYNSPANQVNRLSQAGFNPSAVLSGNGTGLVSAASGNMQNVGSMSVPSGGSVSGAMASPSAAALPQQRPVDLSFIGTMFKDIAEGTKTNASLQPLLDQMAAQTELFLRQAVGQGLANDFQEVQNLIAQATKNPKINQAFADLGLTYAETYLKYKEGEHIDSEVLVNKTEEALNMAKKKLSDKEYEQLCFSVAHLQEGWTNMLQNDAAQRAANYGAANEANASAALHDAQARTERKLLFWKYSNAAEEYYINKAYKEIVHNEQRISDAEFQSRIKKIAISLEREGIINEQLKTQLDMAIKEKDWQTVKNVVGIFKDILGTAGSVAIGGAALKGAGIIGKAPKASTEFRSFRRPDY